MKGEPVSRNSRLGNLIGQVRQRRGLSQAKLGQLVGVTQQALQRYETGHALPADRLVAICRVCRVTPQELLSQCRGDFPEGDGFVEAVREQELLWYEVESTELPQDAVALCRVRLAHGKEERRRGNPQGLVNDAGAAISTLESELRKRNEGARRDVTLTLELLNAYDAKMTAECELQLPGLMESGERDYEAMLKVIKETWNSEREWEIQKQLEFRAKYRLADLYMLSGNLKKMTSGLDAIREVVAKAKDPEFRFEALRLWAGLSRRVDNLPEFNKATRRISDLADRGQGRWLTRSFVYQGAAYNFAALGPQHKPVAMRLLDDAEEAYSAACGENNMDSHIEAIILRTRGLVAATPGPGADLELARSCAQRGYALAEGASRKRTMAHCQLVLQAADAGKLLQAFPD